MALAVHAENKKSAKRGSCEEECVSEVYLAGEQQAMIRRDLYACIVFSSVSQFNDALPYGAYQTAAVFIRTDTAS
jgi:hypothetical protein